LVPNEHTYDTLTFLDQHRHDVLVVHNVKHGPEFQTLIEWVKTRSDIRVNVLPAALLHSSKIWLYTLVGVYIAKQLKGEDLYALFSDNCEHWANFVLCGSARSLQIEGWCPWKKPKAVPLPSPSVASPAVTPSDLPAFTNE
jgi:hypothetical protein